MQDFKDSISKIANKHKGVAHINISEAIDKSIKIINFYSISGNLIENSDPNFLDYSLRMKSLFDTAQKTIATTSKRIRKTEKISQNPIPNQLTDDSKKFDITQHLSDDVTFSSVGTRACCFKVDNISTVYIEEETATDVWTVHDTITHTTPLNEFTEYKRLITPSNIENTIRIRFSGSYVYNIRDVYMSAYTFPSSSYIPSYSEYNLYTMPTNFYKLNKLIYKGSPSLGGSYSASNSYYWESNNVLAIKNDFVGEFTIEYSAYPTTINDSTVNTTEFEVDIDAQEVIPYYVASMMMMHENPSIGNKLFAIYQGMLANLDDSVPNGQKRVKNKMYGDSGTINNVFNTFVP